MSSLYVPKSGAQRLYGRNLAMDIDLDQDPLKRGMFSYFNPYGPSQMWTKLQSGDSGSAWWQFKDGKPVMVAVTNKVTADGNYAARISGHIDWIRSIYPDARLLSAEEPKGCLVLVDAPRRKYCRAPHEAFWPVPDWMRNKDVEVQADNGIEVIVSDITDLSYNRLARFSGTVKNATLRSTRAMNGRLVNFRSPRTMKVGYRADQPLGCVISLVSAEKYCVPAPSPDYTDHPDVHPLPAWARVEDVFVEAAPGASVVLYDAQGNGASFSGRVQPLELKQVRATNGVRVDLSKPVSMSTVRSGPDDPLEIVATDTDA